MYLTRKFHKSSSFKLTAVLAVFLGFYLIYSCSQTESGVSTETSSVHQAFVGDEACRSCHEGPVVSWEGSHHDYAMKEATETTVRGNFSGVRFTHRGESYYFLRNDSLFMVETTGPEGKTARYRITHTFGWEPLQQYLIDFGRGKLQALNIAWDTERKRWFALNPEEDIRHGDWLHWTGGAMNWNSMCADCHSTNLRQNYVASADSFHTTWSSINVSCEACHGPGRDHVAFMKSQQSAQATIDRIRRDLELTADAGQQEQINQCAQCHSLREELTGSYAHNEDYLDHYNPTLPHPPEYFSDGQIRGEVYVYGSFLQSKMYAKGVKCSDCHDPHSLRLKANVSDNTLCMQCHEPRYNTVDHSRHPVNTEASRCISCHMTGRYYMEVDFRRDHSFRVPRPDLSAEYGTPNACNGCHTDQSAEWAARAVERWYGPERIDNYSKILARADSLGPEPLPEIETAFSDTSHPDIARATLIWYLGQYPTREGIDLIERGLYDENELVRISAARALANLPEEQKPPSLQDALADSVRAVRVAAAGGLASYSVAEIELSLKQHFREALSEYRRYLDIGRYFPRGLMNRGQFFERRGEPEKAIEAYRKALEKDPRFNPARVNLAYLQNRLGDDDEAERLLRTVIEQEPEYGPGYYSLALLIAGQNRLEEALSYFERAAGLMPENPRVRYNWAISLQRLNRPKRAEEIYRQAIRMAPDNSEYRYGICTLYMQQEQYEKALEQAQVLRELQPQNERFQRLIDTIKRRLASGSQ